MKLQSRRKCRVDHGRTKRPYEALLYSDIVALVCVRRIGGSLRSADFGSRGDNLEIPPSRSDVTHSVSETERGTVSDG